MASKDLYNYKNEVLDEKSCNTVNQKLTQWKSKNNNYKNIQEPFIKCMKIVCSYFKAFVGPFLRDRIKD